MTNAKEEVESGLCGPKNGKTKMGFFIRMLKNGSIYSTAEKIGSKYIKPGDIDKFCDEAITQIENLRKDWKNIEQE